jgi:hypothetical protein
MRLSSPQMCMRMCECYMFVHMCVCVCVFGCVCVCMRMCECYMFVHMCVCMRMCECYMFVHMFMCVCVWLRVCLSACVRQCMGVSGGQAACVSASHCMRECITLHASSVELCKDNLQSFRHIVCVGVTHVQFDTQDLGRCCVKCVCGWNPHAF